MSKKITTIAVTGGPCAGKSSLLSRIDKTLTEKGYRVLMIPETATELILGGIKPFGGCMSMYDFQRFVFPKQLHKEELYRQAAELVPEEKVVIVCDRGILDNKAYVSDEEFLQLLAMLGRTEAGVRDSYDAVIHLVTAADGAEYAYTLSNNSARTETPEQARELDRKALKAWTGHPHLKVIDNSTDFDGKISRAMNEIYAVLGEPVPSETTRKYLIEYPDIDYIMSRTSCCMSYMMQTYLVSPSPDIERRILQVGQDGDFVYYYAEKQLVASGEHAEKEEHIDEKKYLRLMMDADTRFHQLSKRRLCFVYKSQSFELDLFPFSNERAIISVELTAETQNVLLPDFIKVISDITDDPSYRSYSLALDMKL